MGGAVVIVDAEDVARLGGESRHALLWDLRVAPALRGRGIGRDLLAAAETEARAIGSSGLVVETQDVNAVACSLYSHAGFSLVRADRSAYENLPDEVQLIWAKRFDAGS